MYANGCLSSLIASQGIPNGGSDGSAAVAAAAAAAYSGLSPHTAYPGIPAYPTAYAGQFAQGESTVVTRKSKVYFLLAFLQSE